MRLGREKSVPNFADRVTAEALSGFLRAYSDAWRVRRTDRFVPLDFHLVEHQATLQGNISKALIERFQLLHQGQHQELRSWRVASGMKLPLLIPAFSEPKSLLHEFEIHGANREESLAILPRAESAAVNAVYVFTALRTSGERRKMTQADVASTVQVLIALGYANPRALATRFDLWAAARGAEPLAERMGAPLLDETMLDWIEEEGEGVCDQVGSNLRAQLNRYRAGRLLPIQPGAQALAPFPTVDALLLYGIRDLLRILLNQEPLWGMPPDGGNPRATLAAHPDRLATHASEVVEHGMRELEPLFRVASSDAQSEFTAFLSRYVAYVFLDVEVGRQFLVEFSRVLPVGRRVSTKSELKLAIGQTRVLCPLAPKDAQGVHVVVALPDPEVRFGLDTFEVGLRKPRFVRLGHRRIRVGRDENHRWSERLEDWSLSRRLPDGDREEIPIRRQFGVIDEPSEQLVHFYSARGRYEARADDARLGSVSLVAPIKLTKTIFWAYLLSALFFVIAAAYVGVMWSRGIAHAHLPRHLEGLLTVNALAITLSLWLATTQHRRPIVHKKLLPARYSFFISMFVLLFAPSAYGVYEISRLL